MTQPRRVLDLFSGAGGAAMGLHRAWPDAEIVGVDNRPQKHYPFRFVLSDAMTYSLDGFDFIWASPPCQRFSTMTKRWNRQSQHPDYLIAVRERILATGIPYAIENVRTKQLEAQVMLCGSMFGLPLRRHRYFNMSNPPALTPTCNHTGKVVAVYGHSGGSSKRDGIKFGGISEWRAAMGIDWMNGDELAEAIPPAYSEYIARQLTEQLL